MCKRTYRVILNKINELINVTGITNSNKFLLTKNGSPSGHNVRIDLRSVQIDLSIKSIKPKMRYPPPRFARRRECVFLLTGPLPVPIALVLGLG